MQVSGSLTVLKLVYCTIWHKSRTFGEDEVGKFFFFLIWMVFGGVCAKAWDPAASVDDSVVVLRVVTYFFSVPLTT